MALAGLLVAPSLIPPAGHGMLQKSHDPHKTTLLELLHISSFMSGRAPPANVAQRTRATGRQDEHLCLSTGAHTKVCGSGPKMPVSGTCPAHANDMYDQLGLSEVVVVDRVRRHPSGYTCALLLGTWPQRCHFCEAWGRLLANMSRPLVGRQRHM